MSKLLVCKKLSRLEWMSQAACDYHQVIRRRPLLEGVGLGDAVSSFMFHRIPWSFCRTSRNWSKLYYKYSGQGTRIIDIEL